MGRCDENAPWAPAPRARSRGCARARSPPNAPPRRDDTPPCESKTRWWSCSKCPPVRSCTTCKSLSRDTAIRSSENTSASPSKTAIAFCGDRGARETAMAKRARAPRNARRDVRDARPPGRRLGHARFRDGSTFVSAFVELSKFIASPGYRQSFSPSTLLSVVVVSKRRLAKNAISRPSFGKHERPRRSPNALTTYMYRTFKFQSKKSLHFLPRARFGGAPVAVFSAPRFFSEALEIFSVGARRAPAVRFFAADSGACANASRSPSSSSFPGPA